MKLKIGDTVSFYKPQNDSGYASDLFCVEPQNDWYDVQYYIELVKGKVVKTKGAIIVQHFVITNNGPYYAGFYDISKEGIKKRILEIKDMLALHDIKEHDFLADMEVDKSIGFNIMFEIKKITAL